MSTPHKLAFVGGFTVLAALVQITEAAPKPLVQATAAAPVRSQKGSLSGVVRTLEGEPAVGIRVAAVAVVEGAQSVTDSTAMVSFGTTDGQGRYRLEDVPPGKYYILAGRIDFPTYYPGTVETSGARAIDIVSSDEIQAIDFQIKQPTGVTLRGRLTGPVDSSPVRVELWGEAVGGFIYADSKADGTFEFSGVGLGRAFVRAPGFAALSLNLKEDVSFDLPRELPMPGVTVSGKIRNHPRGLFGRLLLRTQMGGSGIGGAYNGGNNSGASISGGVSVSSLSSSATAGSISGGPIAFQTQVNTDGSFEVAGVLPGTYTLSFGRTINLPLEVRDKDISGIELVVPFEVTLNARVVGLDSRLTVHIPIRATPISDPSRPLLVLTNLDGTFTLRLTEGEYTIAPALLPSGVTLKSVFLGGTDVTRDPLKVEPGMTSELTINLDSAPFESLPGIRVSGRPRNLQIHDLQNRNPERWILRTV